MFAQRLLRLLLLVTPLVSAQLSLVCSGISETIAGR
eukprot:s3735_g1.t1